MQDSDISTHIGDWTDEDLECEEEYLKNNPALVNMTSKQSAPSGNRLIIDWLSFTTKRHAVKDLFPLLGIDPRLFETVNGSKGFRFRQYFGGISIHHQAYQIENVVEGEWVWLEMSGQGCRTFETHGNGDFEKFFALARGDPENIHITRCDIAFDDTTGVFNMDTLNEETRLQNYTSRIQAWESRYTYKGNTVYFGSRFSNILIRIYDKARERGYDEKDNLHWIRCELQLKDENALGFARRIKDEKLSNIFLGVLKNYLIYRTPVETDSNKRRWPVREWWDTFLDDAVRVSLWEKPGVDYNLSKCEHYVLTQPVHSIKTLIKVHGVEKFVEMLESIPPSKNPKYRMLLKEANELAKFGSDKKKVQHIIDRVGEDELAFLVDVKRNLQELQGRLGQAPKYSDPQISRFINEVSSFARRASGLSSPDGYAELSSEGQIDNVHQFEERYRHLHEDYLEKKRKREEEWREAQARTYLRNQGLNVKKKGDDDSS